MSQYAQPNDLQLYAVTSEQFNRFRQASIVPMLKAASSFADSFLSSQYLLPLAAYGEDLTMNVCFIAAFYLWRQVGFNLEAAEDKLIIAMYEQAIDYFKKIASQEIHPTFTDSDPGFLQAQGPFVITESPRGFSPRGMRELANSNVDIDPLDWWW